MPESVFTVVVEFVLEVVVRVVFRVVLYGVLKFPGAAIRWVFVRKSTTFAEVFKKNSWTTIFLSILFYTLIYLTYAFLC
jgi:uncharacterized protein HemY